MIYLHNLKTFFLAVLFLSLTHCAFSKDNNAGVRQDEEDRTRLLKTFNSIVGNYSGKLITTDKEFPVRLKLYIIYLPNGKMESGIEAVTPVLRASYYQMDPPKPQTVFNVTYKSEYQTLQMIAPSPANNQALPADMLVSVDAEVLGQNISGMASRADGPIGRLELVLQDRTALAPTEGETNKYKEDLRSYFQKISGEYVGNVTPDPRKGFPFEIIINLSTPAPGKNGEPELRGYFKRTDREQSKFCTDQFVNVSYLNEYTPPRILIESPADLKASVCYISINGILLENKIQGQYMDRDGNPNPVELKKNETLY